MDYYFCGTKKQLIKQSQDDGGDEVTWRISPVNERLQAVSKQIPTAIQVFPNDSSSKSKLNSFNIRSCSLNQAFFFSFILII